ncbi:MAG: MFS transporter [Candidatus Hodarchaeota archaeon]
MKRLKYKTEVNRENVNESSTCILEKEFLVNHSPKKLIYIYIRFFIVYFTLSLSISYLTIYLPIYLLSILDVNRSNLAFIQILTYSFLFLAPLFAIIYDKYSYQKRKILSFMIVSFILSFIGALSLFSILFIFGILLGLNLFTHEAIKVGMGRLIIESSSTEDMKDKILIIINASSNIGAYIPPLIFLSVVTDIFNLDLWSNFFLIGGISLIPIIFSIFYKNYPQNIPEKKKIRNSERNSSRFYYSQIFLLSLSFIMIFSDKLYSYPFGNWILSRYGQLGISLLSGSYVIFLLLNTLGHIMGKWIAKKLKRKNIILLTNIVYICITLLMVFSTSIIFLLIIYSLTWFVSGIMMLNYISLHINFCRNVEYQATSYQILRVGIAIASVIFIPIGTFLSSFTSTEFLILIAGGLALLSLIPLFFLKNI